MRKHHILYIVLISILSLIYVNSISALSYSNDVGVGVGVSVSFTFNPTISISLSNNNLDISNLMPGNTLDSNSINVSVSSNNANGYTMLATVGNIEYDNTNLNHSNNANTFSSISTNANLASLTTDNTWGYSYSIDSGSSWSNYNGLSLYSDNGTTLINKLGPAESSIDFKIAAKASSTQASGTYSNVINFIAITRPNPVSLEDAYSSYYLSTGKTKHNGYYVMQDMNSTICNNVELLDSELQVIDIRDDKVYWIAKLRDGNCWMTQNLDLDIDETKTYTHWNTDLGWTTNDENATWQPMEGHSTMTSASDWVGSEIQPYSMNPGDMFYYTSNSNVNDTQYNSLQECTIAGHNDCAHYHAGNYYNWPAAVASNDTSSMNRIGGNAPNSICPSGWMLSSSFAELMSIYRIRQSGLNYQENGFDNIRKAPLYFVRAGSIANGNNRITGNKSAGDYWLSIISTGYDYYGVHMYFESNRINVDNQNSWLNGFSLRCLAR